MLAEFMLVLRVSRCLRQVGPVVADHVKSGTLVGSQAHCEHPVSRHGPHASSLSVKQGEQLPHSVPA